MDNVPAASALIVFRALGRAFSRMWTSMFLGRHNHSVDVKGRLAVPSRFREGLEGSAVLTRGIDRCLSLYPLGAWTPLAEKVSGLPLSDPDARNFRRMVFAEAADLELDAQGRLLLPPDLRQYAEIDREAVVVGVNTHIELWNPDRWRALSSVIELGGAEIAQRLQSLI